MDNKKDNQGQNSVSQIPSMGIDSFGTLVLKRCERIATAIYLVTNFLSDAEPLKFRLRAVSLNFIQDASVMKFNGSINENNVFDRLKGNIHETLTLLELAFIVGIVSEMNFTILKREYVSLRETIENKRASRESRTDNLLGSVFFHQSLKTEDAPPKTIDKGQNDIAMSFRMSNKNISARTPVYLPKTSQNLSMKSRQIPNPNMSSRATTEEAKDARRGRILKLVKDNREVSIKDIAEHFVDLSEKTLQRELASLVESGVLKKFGERRWSRYTIA